jgi:AcrR family transcriptional regulator
MPMARWTGAQDESNTRNAIIEATDQLIREEGYAALTSRQIGIRAGVKSPLIHYYFDSLDDLYLTVFQRASENGLRRIDVALNSEDPVRAVWEIMSDPTGARFTMEFNALALHRPAISQALAEFSGLVRDRITEGFERHFKRRRIASPLAPVIVHMLMVAVAAFLTQEKAIGATKGHGALQQAVEQWLRMLDGV